MTICTYKAFYNSKTATVEADSLYAAKLAAVALFKPRRAQAHMVSVILVHNAAGPVPIQNSNADFG